MVKPQSFCFYFYTDLHRVLLHVVLNIICNMNIFVNLIYMKKYIL